MFSNCQRILVATDFSLAADAATKFAARLAHQLGAAVDLVTVIDTSALVDARGAIAFRSGEIQTLVQAARAKAAELAGCHFGDIDRVETQVRDGNAAVEILHAAEELGSDVIVMGTRGRSGIANLLLGSVADKVIRRSSVPVITVSGAAPCNGAQERPSGAER